MWRTMTGDRAAMTALVATALLAAAPACGDTAANDSDPARPAANAAVGKDAGNDNAAPPQQAGRNWPLFRGDSQSSGVARTTLPANPELLWQFKVKDGGFESTAAIVDGVVYIADLDGVVYALRLADGSKLWSRKVAFSFNASPSVRDGRIYIGDIDGRFYCLDAKTGKSLWNLPPASDDPPVPLKPAAEGESSEPTAAANKDNNDQAAEGPAKTVPYFETGAEINSAATFYKDNVLVGSQDAVLYCLGAKTGKLVWKHEIEDQIRCTPTVAGDRTFVAGCDSRLHIIDLKTGKEVGSVDIEAPTGVTPAVRGDMVYFGTEGGAFFAIDWKKPRIVWRYRDTRNQQAYRSSPAVTDKLVVVGSRSKHVRAFDPKTGQQKWVFTARRRVDSSPVIVGDRIFVGSDDGKLYALSAATGKSEWDYAVRGASFISSPAVADGRLVIASDEGVVYCFGKK